MVFHGTMNKMSRIVFPMLTAMLFADLAAAAAKEYIAYVGTYTRGKSKGIYAFRLDSGSGKLTPLGLAGEVANPSFLALHQNGKYLYAASELYTFEGQKSGAVTAFSIDRASGKLAMLNRVPTQGTSPCHLNVDRTGKYLLLVNYGSGSTASFPIKEDGSLGEAVSVIQHKGSSVDQKRQAGPHAHSINISADNRFAVVADLGSDDVFVYKFDASNGKLSMNDPPSVKVKPGSGPRHFTFHPKGPFAYVINEMGSSVTAFDWNAKAGTLKEIQTITTLPADFKGVNHCAEVVAHPSGRFLYGSNRGHDTLAGFAIDPQKGTLTFIEHTPTQGKIPRNFAIEPGGNFLIAANQDSDNIVVFKVDQKTGKLTPTGQNLEVGAPVCIRYLPVK
jgi:6-phosphogluconolactonase